MKKVIYVALLVVSTVAFSSFKNDKTVAKHDTVADRTSLGTGDDRTSLGTGDARKAKLANDRTSLGTGD